MVDPASRRLSKVLLVALLAALLSENVNAFTIHCLRVPNAMSASRQKFRPAVSHSLPLTAKGLSSRSANTSLKMYNLPPPNDNRNGLGAILTSILTLVLTVGFFMSPLGAFVLSIFNSLLLLAIATPIAVAVGFNIWEYFNTISGPCPNCGAPIKVYKQNENSLLASPSICLNCGSIVQASDDNKAISLTQQTRNTVANEDDLLGWLMGTQTTRTTTTTSTRVQQDEKGKKYRREQTIIDVDVEDE